MPELAGGVDDAGSELAPVSITLELASVLDALLAQGVVGLAVTQEQTELTAPRIESRRSRWFPISHAFQTH